MAVDFPQKAFLGHAMDRAVVPARGLGTRMRKADPAVHLDPARAAAAEGGIKALIPIDRPFLDYVLSVVADAGFRRVCLVVGPEHHQVREYYTQLRPRRLQIEFAIQAQPLGTADAVAAAEAFAAGEEFLAINSDNYYPLSALQALHDASRPALAAFDRQAMLEGSNIPPERLPKFAVVEADQENRLRRIVEKPDAATLRRLGSPLGVSMNCWRFGPAIFAACRAIAPSPRGELELTDAVQYAIDHGSSFDVIWCKAPVLDLSSRGDIAPVASRLAGKEVNL